MIRIPIFLNDLDDVKHLVQVTASCQWDVDLICGRYVVDAKSMLGIFSLPHFGNLELGVDEHDEDMLRDRLEELRILRK